MSDSNETKTAASTSLGAKLSLRREKIKILRVRSELRTGLKKDTCTDDSATWTCTISGGDFTSVMA
jgi:hypothetical protein